MAATDTENNMGSRSPREDEDPEIGVPVSTHTQAEEVEEDDAIATRKDIFLSCLLKNYAIKDDELGPFFICEFPAFLSRALQSLLVIILVAFDAAAEIERRRKHGKWVSSQANRKLMNFYLWEKSRPVNNFARKLILLVAFFDTIPTFLTDIWLKIDASGFKSTIMSSLLSEGFWRTAEFRPLLRLLEKNTKQISMHSEWYRLLTCMLVHSSWKYLLFGLAFLHWNSRISMIARIGTAKSFGIILLASLGASLFHFYFAPNKTEVGSQSFAFLVIGMTYADVVVNFNILLTVRQLGNPGCYPSVYIAKCFAGLFCLLWLIFGLLSKWTSPVVMMAYLLYGFCASFPFIPRLDMKHPGFFGHQPQRSKCLQVGKAVCLVWTVTSMLYFSHALLCHQEDW